MLLQRILCRAKTKFDYQHKCSLSSSTIFMNDKTAGKMKSWQVHSYGGLEELQLSDSRAPFIKNPNELIIEVAASSVNPIDLFMMNGVGSNLFNKMRQIKACSFENILEFPLTLGRDFSGTVIQKGHGVKGSFSIGDEVWGVVPVQDQGCHAEQVLVPENCVLKKPNNISMVEAGGMLYAAVTAWSALKITGNLATVPALGKTVLVLGGSGGVGTMAVQLLSRWGAYVVSTCSTDAVELLKSLNVDEIIDYKDKNHLEKIKEHKYDIILDCAGLGQENAAVYLPHLKDSLFSKFITLSSPVLKNITDYGLLGGSIKCMTDLMMANFKPGTPLKVFPVRWGFFFPLKIALEDITNEVNRREVIPVIQKVYPFSELKSAYEFVQNGHLRGKVVIDLMRKS